MRITRAFCAMSCSGSSRAMPIAPNACAAWSTISPTISVAKTFTIAAAWRMSSPRSNRDARVVHHEAAGVDVGDGVGDPPLDCLPVGKRCAEGHALLHMRTHHVERSPRQPDRPGPDLQPAH